MCSTTSWLLKFWFIFKLQRLENEETFHYQFVRARKVCLQNIQMPCVFSSFHSRFSRNIRAFRASFCESSAPKPDSLTKTSDAGKILHSFSIWTLSSTEQDSLHFVLLVYVEKIKSKKDKTLLQHNCSA